MLKIVIIILFYLQTSSLNFIDYINSNNQGIKYYSDKKFDSAKEFFLKAKKENPKSIEVKFNLANSIYKMKDYKESEKKYLEILKKKDLNKNIKQKTTYNLANTFYKLGIKDIKNKKKYWQKALERYKESINIKPDDLVSKENYDFVKAKIEKLETKQNKVDKQKKNKNTNNISNKKINKQKNNDSLKKIKTKYNNKTMTKNSVDKLLKDLKKQENMSNNDLIRKMFSEKSDFRFMSKNW